jgi:phosphoglycolate phosphatase
MSEFTYKHIIWDWNGTLFDDAWLCLETMNTLLSKRGLPLLTAERYQQIFDFPVIEYYRRLGFDFSVEPFFALSTEFILAYKQRLLECRLRPEALAVLQRNYKQGLTQSILSASKQASLEEALNHFGISEMFVAVAGLDNHHAFGKVDLGQRLISTLAVNQRDILLIGDTVHDYEVAQAMGVDCCLIPGGHQAYSRLTASGARVSESLTMVFNLSVRQ